MEFRTPLAGLISIHAPRMGSDMLGVQMFPGYDDFNPRSPDGERRAPQRNQT